MARAVNECRRSRRRIGPRAPDPFVSTKPSLIAFGVPTHSLTGGAVPPRGSRSFVAACIVLGSVLVALYVWLAHQEYFFGDDLVFLRRAQLPRDWGEVFVSFRPRGWWSYRPLSIEVFFSTLYAVAGLDPFPYLLASVLVHFAAGFLVYRLAVQLEIDRRVALIAGLLKVSMYPSLNGELFWISAFQTVLGSFFYLLTVTLFVDYLTRGRRRHQVAASVAMILALLSNELAITLPGPLVLLGVFFGSGGPTTRLNRALRACAPMVVILAVYLPFRYVLIWASFLPTPGLNVPHLGWHIPWNVRNFLRILTKQSGALQIVLLAIVAAGWLCAARSRSGDVATLARRGLLLSGWLLCAMVPFLGAYFLHHRAAIVLEAPFCLLLASHLDPIVRAAVSLRARRLVELAMIGLVLVAFPYQATADQARMPRGKVNRDLLEILAREPELPPGACVRLRTRAEDSWESIEIFALRFNTTGLMPVFSPGRHLELPAEPGRPQLWRQRCVAIIEIELLHGIEGRHPTFELRRVKDAAS